MFEPLCNILLKRLKPSIFIPVIMYGSHRPNLQTDSANHSQGRLGLCHDFHGIRRELVRLDGRSLVPRNGRSRSLPRDQLLSLLLVQTRRIRH